MGYSITAVTAHHDPIIAYLTIDGETIETTPKYPFYGSESGWVGARQLCSCV